MLHSIIPSIIILFLYSLFCVQILLLVFLKASLLHINKAQTNFYFQIFVSLFIFIVFMGFSWFPIIINWKIEKKYVYCLLHQTFGKWQYLMARQSSLLNIFLYKQNVKTIYFSSFILNHEFPRLNILIGFCCYHKFLHVLYLFYLFYFCC